MGKRRKQRIGKKGTPVTARRKPLAKSIAETSDESRTVFSAEDKRYLLCFLGISIVLTAFYWFIGGRNLFVFPAVFCLSVGTSKFWRGPVRRFAEKNTQL